MSRLNGWDLMERRLERYSQTHAAGECWIWPNAIEPGGYGVCGFLGKQWRAHRLAYFVATGIDPGGLLVRHACDNPPCFNPGHLSTGTVQDNADDRWRHGRYHRHKAPRTHCPEGHALAEENRYERSDGAVQCRSCVNRKARERRLRIKGECASE